MEPAEQSEEIIQRMLDKSNDLRLSKDVLFLVGPPDELKKFSATELIELVKSNDFILLFSESAEAEKIDEIFVPNLGYSVFLNLLRYVYQKKMISDLKDVYSTYAAADRYSLTELTGELLRFCEANLTIDNSTIIYDQYLQIGDLRETDVKRVLDIINPHAFLAFHSIQFLRIRRETLIDLLGNDKLFIKEKDLYLRCLCWMNAEFVRQGLAANKKNKMNLFNELKRHIRFPTMLQAQFFDMEAPVSPSRCGLFTSRELKEFEKYYRTGSVNALSVDYKTHPRIGLKLGKLTLNRVKKTFEMNVDDVLGCDEEKEFLLTNFVDCGGDFPGLAEMESQTRRATQVLTKSGGVRKTKSTASLTNNNVESIRLFRIQSNCSLDFFERGYHPSILENGENMNIKFRGYLVDDSVGYFDIYPNIELKKDHKYCFEFFTHDNQYSSTTFKLTNVYTVKKDAAQINVKLKLMGKLDWALPESLYFLYE